MGKAGKCGNHQTADLSRVNGADNEDSKVILKAMSGKLKWWEAAGIIGVTGRTMRRWREKYNAHGYIGLQAYRKRSPS